MGESTPCSTWYLPRNSRVRSMATTSRASHTTQITEPSRPSSAQMAHGVTSVYVPQTGQ